MTHKAWFATVAAFFLSCASAATALPAEAAPAPHFTGTQLVSALLPASYFGPGMSLLKDATSDSGSHLEHGPARYSLAKSSCTDFYNQPLDWGETAMASDAIGNKAQTAWYSQEVFQFASSTAAAAFFHGSYNAFHRCAIAVLSGNGLTARFTIQHIAAGRVGSFQSFTVDQTITFSSGSPHYNRIHYVYVLDGTDVYEVIPGSTTTPKTSAVVPIFNALRARVGRL
jgi:hypothetical protein